MRPELTLTSEGHLGNQGLWPAQLHTASQGWGRGGEVGAASAFWLSPLCLLLAASQDLCEVGSPIYACAPSLIWAPGCNSSPPNSPREVTWGLSHQEDLGLCDRVQVSFLPLERG